MASSIKERCSMSLPDHKICSRKIVVGIPCKCNKIFCDFHRWDHGCPHKPFEVHKKHLQAKFTLLKKPLHEDAFSKYFDPGSVQ